MQILALAKATVNVDEEPELASRFQIMSIPTLFVIKDGKIKNHSVGTKSKDEILAVI
ncbi:thioredoxin [Coprococcus sp. AM14-16]|nr:thioredoxin [Coprococcus sp. AM14-16]